MNLDVTGVTDSYTIGGTVTGLAGSGLVLQNNGGDDLAITANGGFTFSTPVDEMLGYSVTVLTQPSSPSQTCALSANTGTVANSDITDVVVKLLYRQLHRWRHGHRPRG